jgi:hypothetical protein
MFLFIVAGINVVVNNITVFGIAREMQQRVPPALLCSIHIFHIVINPYPANVENMVSS